MTKHRQPAYGEQKITLLGPKKKGGKHTLVRQAFSDRGTSTFYDDEAKDFIVWRGSWQVIETMGEFDGKGEAREFMLAREAAA